MCINLFDMKFWAARIVIFAVAVGQPCKFVIFAVGQLCIKNEFPRANAGLSLI